MKKCFCKKSYISFVRATIKLWIMKLKRLEAFYERLDKVTLYNDNKF